MSCSRISRSAVFLFLLAAILATGCEDDLADPTMAPVELRFSSTPAGLWQGAEVRIDGRLITDSLAVGSIDTLLAEGPHTFVVRKGCVTVDPAESLVVEILGGRAKTIDFEMSLRCGLLSIRFLSDVEGLANGSRVWVDGILEVDSLTVDQLDFLLEPGEHAVVVEKECVTISPAGSLQVQIEEATTLDLELTLESAGVLSVASDPAGLPISLDGEPTGLVTPAAFPCIEPGTYEIGVHPEPELGFSFVGDTTKTVTVAGSGETPVEFLLSNVPLPQSRGVFVELLTATLCPNCGPAEEAVAELEHDPDFEADQLATAEIHLSWGGSNPFFNIELGNRSSFYGISSQAPAAFFNGTDEVIGAGSGDVEELKETYRARILNTYGQESLAGLYWRNVRVEGDLLRGDLRFVAIGDLSGLEEPQLNALYTKDSLGAWQYPHQWNDFFAVARDFMDNPLDLKEMDLTSPASVLDLEVVFDLSLDAEWETPSIRLVAIIQDMASREVIQCREVRLRFP